MSKGQNPDNAASNKWMLSMGGQRSLELMTRKTMNFEIPGISSEGSEGPRVGNVMMDMGSDTIVHEPLMFTFIVDADYGNYKTIRQWMVENSKSGIMKREDATITLLNSRGQPQGVSLSYMGCRPTSLSAVTLDTIGEPVLLCTVMLKYLDSDFD